MDDGELKRVSILMIGLENSGKTSLLYLWKTNTIINPATTIGCNFESIKYENFNFDLWDLGWQIKPKSMRHYTSKVQFIFWVVDSSSQISIELSAENLKKFITENSLNNYPLLILANKSDLDTAESLDYIGEKFALGSFTNPTHIVSTSLKNASDKEICFSWVLSQLPQK